MALTLSCIMRDLGYCVNLSCPAFLSVPCFPVCSPGRLAVLRHHEGTSSLLQPSQLNSDWELCPVHIPCLCLLLPLGLLRNSSVTAPLDRCYGNSFLFVNSAPARFVRSPFPNPTRREASQTEFRASGLLCILTLVLCPWDGI